LGSGSHLVAVTTDASRLLPCPAETRAPGACPARTSPRRQATASPQATSSPGKRILFSACKEIIVIATKNLRDNGVRTSAVPAAARVTAQARARHAHPGGAGLDDRRRPLPPPDRSRARTVVTGTASSPALQSHLAGTPAPAHWSDWHDGGRRTSELANSILARDKVHTNLEDWPASRRFGELPTGFPQTKAGYGGDAVALESLILWWKTGQ